MDGLARWMFIVAVVSLLNVSGCCTISPQPCCTFYDSVKTEHYDLSPDAKQELDMLNASLIGETNASVRLNVCNNIILTRIVKQEIADNVKRSCEASDLSKEQRDDCLNPDCQARLRAEWCAGLSDVIEKHLQECSMFRYEGRDCSYTEAAAQ